MLRIIVVILAISSCYALPYTGRIVGGAEATEGQFPYQAALELTTGHQCGGTVLNNRWIVTAAHCILGQSAAAFTVRLGTTTLVGGGDSYKVDKLIMHNEYDTKSKQNDIALVRTTTEIQFSDKVQPLPVADFEVEEKIEAVVSGWGFTKWPPSGTPNNLKFINVPTIANTDCALRMIWFGTVTENQICTLSYSGGVCGGDSGGPLVVDGHLVGIVSWGLPCAKGYPDVFVKTSAYLDWINVNMS